MFDCSLSDSAMGVINIFISCMGADDDDDVAERDAALRREAVENFLCLISKPKLPDVLAQVSLYRVLINIHVILFVIADYGVGARGIRLFINDLLQGSYHR